MRASIAGVKRTVLCPSGIIIKTTNVDDIAQKHANAKLRAANALKTHIVIDALYERSRPIIDRVQAEVSRKIADGQRPSAEELWIALNAEKVLIDHLRSTGMEFDELANEVDRLLQKYKQQA